MAGRAILRPGGRRGRGRAGAALGRVGAAGVGAAGRGASSWTGGADGRTTGGGAIGTGASSTIRGGSIGAGTGRGSVSCKIGPVCVRGGATRCWAADAGASATTGGGAEPPREAIRPTPIPTARQPATTTGSSQARGFRDGGARRARAHTVPRPAPRPGARLPGAPASGPRRSGSSEFPPARGWPGARAARSGGRCRSRSRTAASCRRPR